MIKVITTNIIEQTGVLDLVWRVFKEFEAPEYSDEGIQEFQNFIVLDSVKKRLGSGKLLMWGYWVNDKIVGMIATKPPCHISLLFVDKNHHRKGIAKSLFGNILDYYIENSAYDEITVNSSPYAVEFYHRLGFIDIDTEKTVNGLRFTPMKHIFR